MLFHPGYEKHSIVRCESVNSITSQNDQPSQSRTRFLRTIHQVRKNKNVVITNHQHATLPGLQPAHDGDSHKQEIPAKTKTITSSKYQQCFAIKLCMPQIPPILIPLQRETRGVLSEVHRILRGGLKLPPLIFRN